MKKQFFSLATVRKYTAATLTTAILLAGSLKATANGVSEKSDKPTISYAGTANSIMIFNVSYNNPANEKVVLELADETGVVIYRKEYSGEILDKNIYLKNAGEKCQVKFSIKTGKEITNQRFEIEPQLKVVKQTIVTKL